MGVISLWLTSYGKKKSCRRDNPSATSRSSRAITLQEASCPGDAGDGHPRTQSQARC